MSDIKVPQKRPEKVLAKTAVRTISEPGRYMDGGCLQLVVEKSGAKRWVLRVAIHGKRRDMGLGSAQLVTLDEARDAAHRWRKIAREGGDPIQVRNQERQVLIVPTFKEAAEEVHKNRAKTFRNDKHAAQWINSLENYVFPTIGRRRVNDIGSADVIQVLAPIWTTIPETARRIRQRMKIVFQFAKAKNFRGGDNPVEGVSEVLGKHNTKQKHHAALPYSQLPAFVEQLRAIPNEKCSEPVKLALEFLILNCSRTSEVLRAKWEEVNLDAKTWTVPAERMKANAEHRVPLAPRSIEILEAAKKLSDGGPYIFPGRSRKRPLSNMAFNMALRRMERTNITPHGFRSSFRDWAEERTSFPHSVVEAALAHTVKNRVEAAYLRTKLFDKRVKLAEVWAQFVTAPSARVVRIRA